jgi:serine-type D-Ala-D-Ala endopeptidase (penicillin-binding protein 7)
LKLRLTLLSTAFLGLALAFGASMPTTAQAKQPQVVAKNHAAKTVKVSRTKAIKASARSSTSRSNKRRTVARSVISVGTKMGLANTPDPLRLKSNAALVIDQDTHEVLFSKNDEAVLPIASLTKLMTGLIINDANLDLDEQLVITSADVDRIKRSSSRLRLGTKLTRGQALHLALMSSENRAAHALARTFPGGEAAFVANMNAKASLLGMTDTQYVEPTGLSSENRSSARDLAILVSVAHDRPLLRELSTAESYSVVSGRGRVQYHNSNGLVKSNDWDIGLQKTGYISEAGRCLVMQTSVAGRNLIMVFLDSKGKYTRLADARRVRTWVETTHPNGEHAATVADSSRS